MILSSKNLEEFGGMFIKCAIENHAQLIRFVNRKEITSDEAAQLSVNHAVALVIKILEQNEEWNKK